MFTFCNKKTVLKITKYFYINRKIKINFISKNVGANFIIQILQGSIDSRCSVPFLRSVWTQWRMGSNSCRLEWSVSAFIPFDWLSYISAIFRFRYSSTVSPFAVDWFLLKALWNIVNTTLSCIIWFLSEIYWPLFL